MTNKKKFHKTIEVLDHASIPSGTYFTATYGKRKISGLVFNDKRNYMLYFNQNYYNGTSHCPNGLGYKYSTILHYHNQQHSRLKDIQFPTPPKGFKSPVIFPTIAGYYPTILKGKVKIGCKEIDNEDIRFLIKHLKD